MDDDHAKCFVQQAVRLKQQNWIQGAWAARVCKSDEILVFGIHVRSPSPEVKSIYILTSFTGAIQGSLVPGNAGARDSANCSITETNVV